uniref:C3H1-type domain-containing protein n=1 Tax=Chromera velia CCMP2878 TaxID=1169474 RepID=A0A0G4G8B7_9ALVE|eukprot:Cvel_20737.t1-p1 / transcript=Cvel_20737.t1 / gene=Cvel_20737 / organism=Chromera_velia_CCMP2878 / gene_product=Zinc finger protein 36, C3H1 type-like 1, putative / transcript_product=Zinc finger protein 36, C3H1 type-like 1, putative / location=Cvel_scaffold1889:4108-12042(+) / protein_length=1513 / sequence_SO=supercontig / SO=protein_coding / is_pseudo=false
MKESASGGKSDLYGRRPSRACEEQFFRIKMCPWLEKGTCFRGEKCTYAHSEDQLVKNPVPLQKTRLCQPFMRGECHLSSDQCRFAHGNAELRATNEYFKTALCRFWQQGTCPQGAACRHAHGNEELRRPRSGFEKPAPRDSPSETPLRRVSGATLASSVRASATASTRVTRRGSEDFPSPQVGEGSRRGGGRGEEQAEEENCFGGGMSGRGRRAETSSGCTSNSNSNSIRSLMGGPMLKRRGSAGGGTDSCLTVHSQSSRAPAFSSSVPPQLFTASGGVEGGPSAVASPAVTAVGGCPSEVPPPLANDGGGGGRGSEEDPDHGERASMISGIASSPPLPEVGGQISSPFVLPRGKQQGTTGGPGTETGGTMSGPGTAAPDFDSSCVHSTAADSAPPSARRVAASLDTSSFYQAAAEEDGQPDVEGAEQCVVSGGGDPPAGPPADCGGEGGALEGRRAFEGEAGTCPPPADGMFGNEAAEGNAEQQQQQQMEFNQQMRMGGMQQQPGQQHCLPCLSPETAIANPHGYPNGGNGIAQSPLDLGTPGGMQNSIQQTFGGECGGFNGGNGGTVSGEMNMGPGMFCGFPGPGGPVPDGFNSELHRQMMNLTIQQFHQQQEQERMQHQAAAMQQQMNTQFGGQPADLNQQSPQPMLENPSMAARMWGGAGCPPEMLMSMGCGQGMDGQAQWGGQQDDGSGAPWFNPQQQQQMQGGWTEFGPQGGMMCENGNWGGPMGPNGGPAGGFPPVHAQYGDIADQQQQPPQAQEMPPRQWNFGGGMGGGAGNDGRPGQMGSPPLQFHLQQQSASMGGITGPPPGLCTPISPPEHQQQQRLSHLMQSGPGPRGTGGNAGAPESPPPASCGRRAMSWASPPTGPSLLSQYSAEDGGASMKFPSPQNNQQNNAAAGEDERIAEEMQRAVAAGIPSSCMRRVGACDGRGHGRIAIGLTDLCLETPSGGSLQEAEDEEGTGGEPKRSLPVTPIEEEGGKSGGQMEGRGEAEREDDRKRLPKHSPGLSCARASTCESSPAVESRPGDGRIERARDSRERFCSDATVSATVREDTEGGSRREQGMGPETSPSSCSHEHARGKLREIQPGVWMEAAAAAAAEPIASSPSVLATPLQRGGSKDSSSIAPAAEDSPASTSHGDPKQKGSKKKKKTAGTTGVLSPAARDRHNSLRPPPLKTDSNIRFLQKTSSSGNGFSLSLLSPSPAEKMERPAEHRKHRGIPLPERHDEKEGGEEKQNVLEDGQLQQGATTLPLDARLLSHQTPHPEIPQDPHAQTTPAACLTPFQQQQLPQPIPLGCTQPLSLPIRDDGGSLSNTGGVPLPLPPAGFTPQQCHVGGSSPLASPMSPWMTVLLFNQMLQNQSASPLPRADSPLPPTDGGVGGVQRVPFCSTPLDPVAQQQQMEFLQQLREGSPVDFGGTGAGAESPCFFGLNNCVSPSPSAGTPLGVPLSFHHQLSMLPKEEIERVTSGSAENPESTTTVEQRGNLLPPRLSKTCFMRVKGSGSAKEKRQEASI